MPGLRNARLASMVVPLSVTKRGQSKWGEVQGGHVSGHDKQGKLGTRSAFRPELNHTLVTHDSHALAFKPPDVVFAPMVSECGWQMGISMSNFRTVARRRKLFGER